MRVSRFEDVKGLQNVQRIMDYQVSQDRLSINSSPDLEFELVRDYSESQEGWHFVTS